MMLNKKKALALSSIQTVDEVEYIEATYDYSTSLCQYVRAEMQINFDKDVILQGTFMLTGAHRAVVWGGYSGSPTLNIEETAQRKIRMYIMNQGSYALVDKSTTETYPLNTPIMFKWTWTASTGAYTFEVHTLDNSISSSISGTTTRTGTAPGTTYLFIDPNRASTMSSAFNGTLRIYKIEYFEDGILTAQFLPMQKNGVPYMYDSVRKLVLFNKGAGYLKAGRKIREVEYLESSGTQYVNTLVNMGSDSGVEIFAKQTNTTTGKARYLFGLTTDGKKYMLAIASGTDCYLFDLESGTNRLNTSFSGYDGQFHAHKIDNRTYYIDGVSQGTSSYTGTFTGPTSSFLFGCAGASRTNCYWQIKYAIQRDGSNNKLRDYIPAIDENGVGFMFDRVSHTIFDNAGTGAFTYGRRIIPVEYIESSGTQYINTGVYMKQNYGVEINVKQAATSAGTARYLFGDYTSSSAAYMLGLIPDGVYICDLKQYSNRITTDFSGYDGVFHTQKIINSSYYIDGVLQGTASPSEFTTQGQAWLFGVKNRGASGSYWQIRNAILTDENNNKIMDYIPAIDENRKGFMFDRVTHTIYDNAGSGKFKYASTPRWIRGLYEQLEYLESTGTQYIDTGVKVNCNMGVEILAKQTSTQKGQSRYLFGNYDSNKVEQWFIAVRSGNNGYLFTINNGIVEYPNAYDGLFHTHKVVNKEYFVDGNSCGTISVADFTATKNSYLFHANGISFNKDTFQIKYAIIRAYDGTVLRYFIPVRRIADGVLGMYDKINNAFYQNAGTGTFIAGEVIC